MMQLPLNWKPYSVFPENGGTLIDASGKVVAQHVTQENGMMFMALSRQKACTCPEPPYQVKGKSIRTVEEEIAAEEQRAAILRKVQNEVQNEVSENTVGKDDKSWPFKGAE